ncbi:MAG TPA: DUF3592 domain-containing protein [Chthoniobacterales bacterium]|jgi:hypothetical protein|nr:DUF3592 domain-containing protein [Chthoniobacterales bacterium]
MKTTPPPSAEAMETYSRIFGAGLVALVLAAILWWAQDFVADLGATQMTAHTTLRTMEEHDDARVRRAFATARRPSRVRATLETEENPKQETRDAVLTVTADSKSDAISGLREISEAMQRAFAQEGAGELHNIGNRPTASPVPNARMEQLRTACRIGALLLLAVAVTLVVRKWRRSGLPSAALFGILASLGTLGLVFLGRSGAVAWGILIIAAPPVLLVVLLARLTMRVRRAASWVEGRATITKSEVEVERHRFAGEATKVKNLASVCYDYSVGETAFQGDRISLGDGPADRVDETLIRYPVGATVPVFYDPANPEESVLERDPPAKLGRMWAGVILFAVIYGAVVFSFWSGVSINAALAAALPQIHHPLLAIGAGVLGLLSLSSGVWNWAHPRQTEAWKSTRGRIVSSEVETYTDTDASTHTHTRFYQAVIEFAYDVEGQEYHNTVSEPGTGKESASAEAARYPAGTELDVYYDPANPTNSALTGRPSHRLDGRASLVVSFVAIAAAIYIARH